MEKVLNKMAFVHTCAHCKTEIVGTKFVTIPALI